ncbi:MAG: TraR/DksA C4-type zinc finger protein [Anaerolineae bacterium]|nr:TraR/DksA C4-type zinc finger protein [Anaerolineae bacterium]
MELTEIKQRLQTDLQKTKEELERLTELLEEKQVSGLDAGSAGFYTWEMNLARKEQAVNQLEILRNALNRIEAGTYEVCAQCGRCINPERLEILPTTTLCLNCATKQQAEDLPDF